MSYFDADIEISSNFIEVDCPIDGGVLEKSFDEVCCTDIFSKIFVEM